MIGLLAQDFPGKQRLGELGELGDHLGLLAQSPQEKSGIFEPARHTKKKAERSSALYAPAELANYFGVKSRASTIRLNGILAVSFSSLTTSGLAASKKHMQ